MSLREQVAKFFARPKPDAREALNKAGGALDQLAADNEKAEREKEAAITAKQTELLRSHLTPERTPLGTQPKTPPTKEEARAQAEKLIAAKDHEPARGKDAAEKKAFRLNDGKPGQEAGPTLRGEAERGGFAATPGNDGDNGKPGPTEIKKEAAPAKADHSDGLQGEEVTPAYIAEVVQWQAVHEVAGEEERSGASLAAAERNARIAARAAEIEAERTSAALDHSHTHGGGGRTL